MKQEQIDQLTFLQRARSATPGFFKKLRNIGLLLTAIGGAIFAAPITLPTILVTAAGYLTVAGTVVSAISQLTVKAPEEDADLVF
jgi:hypothetical protein